MDEDGNPIGNIPGDISVKHNSAKYAKAGMIGVRALFTIDLLQQTISQRLKTKALPHTFACITSGEDENSTRNGTSSVSEAEIRLA